MRTTKKLLILTLVLGLVGANKAFGQPTITVSPSGDLKGLTGRISRTPLQQQAQEVPYCSKQEIST